MYVSDSDLNDAVIKAGGYRPAARFLQSQGYTISERTIRRRMSFELDLPEGEQAEAIDVEALILRRFAQFERKKEIKQRERIIGVNIKYDGPIGVGIIGDPHLDDDGTDLKKAFDHAKLFNGSTPGLYAGNIGDVTNNWVGRLARLYAQQSTSSAEALAITKEYVELVNWLFFIFGNHDVWQGGDDILKMLLSGSDGARKSGAMRLALKFTNGRVARIHASHNFKGSSQWSDVFGASKRAQLDGTSHLYVNGHTHVSGYTHGWHDGNQQMWHALQIASYKTYDRYAEELDLMPATLYVCPVVLIDPYATDEINFLRFEMDPFEGVERLKWMQSRYQSGKSAS